eukprot:TRINITY_DN6680_c1_g1_i2.p1 TRINITY_DN6680_c1_g1~~TRINITY_DN6680_c1_g1_i2.p1  ORF type:complete len:580 (-),score=131.58 TRINITY_DN6680_c1_g1_i2:69-1808(-)
MMTWDISNLNSPSFQVSTMTDYISQPDIVAPEPFPTHMMAYNPLSNTFFILGPDYKNLHIVSTTTSRTYATGASEVFMTSDNEYIILAGGITNSVITILSAMNGDYIGTIPENQRAFILDDGNLMLKSIPFLQITSDTTAQFRILNGTHFIDDAINIKDVGYSIVKSVISTRRSSRSDMLFLMDRDPTGSSIRLVMPRNTSSETTSQMTSMTTSMPSSSAWSDERVLDPSQDDSQPRIIAIAIVVPVAAIVIVGLAILFMWKRSRRSKDSSTHIDLSPIDSHQYSNAMSSTGYSLEDWNIPSSHVELGSILGSGAFGVVMKARWRNADCVIKQLSDKNCDQEVFLKEALTMKKLRAHKNVCKFMGVIMEPNYPTSILCEYIEGGSLNTWINEGRLEIENMAQAISLVLGVASGMSHIHAEDIIHCDLAARNLLIQRESDGYTIKVADFGMSHTIKAESYNIEGEINLPVRWCSPEVLRTHTFSKASDVWAFGIVIWEIIEQKRPYYQEPRNKEVFEMITNGVKLERPKRIETSDEMMELMNWCWKMKPHSRPTFQEIIGDLDQQQKDAISRGIVSNQIK